MLPSIGTNYNYYAVTNLDLVIDIPFWANILYSLQIKALGASLS